MFWSSDLCIGWISSMKLTGLGQFDTHNIIVPSLCSVGVLNIWISNTLSFLMGVRFIIVNSKVFLGLPDPLKYSRDFFVLHLIVKTLTPLESSQHSESDDMQHSESDDMHHYLISRKLLYVQ